VCRRLNLLKICFLIYPFSAASPFVITLDNAGIKGLSRKLFFSSQLFLPVNRFAFSDFVNATICISVLSIGLSSVYAGSRTLTALAETGYAPKIFTYGAYIPQG
jgi:yeast amino acid transporter